jgi:anti-anti-sigma factor
MRLKVRLEGRVVVVQLEGDISGKDAVKIQQRLEELEAEHRGVLAIDLSRTDFIDSHGLGVLIYQWNIMEKSGRKLVFLAPSAFVKEVIGNTNLDKIITVVESTEGL